MTPLRCISALFCIALFASPSARAQSSIQVKGSDAIGAQLGTALARAFQEQHAGVRVEWESLGSGSAFVGLFDGSAQLGAASRPVNAEELELAERLGIRLREYVIGYDAVAVIVHPDNRLREVSREQLAELFSGGVNNWKELGGSDRRVELISLPSYSGAHALWNELIFHNTGAAEGEPSFAETTRFLEDGADVVSEVSRSSRAVGYVSLAQVGERAVRVLALSSGSGQPAVPADAQHIRDGSYPLHRALYLYSRGEPQGALRDLVEFALSPAGQQLVARAGFVSRDVPASLGDAPAAAEAPEPKAPMRIRFSTGSKRLNSADHDELDKLLPQLRDGSQAVLVRGHADGLDLDPKSARYALERAEEVASYLRSKGVASAQLETSASAGREPLASNESSEGRQLNRRVDLHLVPAAKVSAAGAPEAQPAGTDGPG